MGLLNWFFGSKQEATLNDRIWLSQVAKEHGLARDLKQRLKHQSTILLVSQFQETLTRMDKELSRQHVPRALTHHPIAAAHLVSQFDRGHKSCVVLALRRQLEVGDHKPGDAPKTTRIERIIQGAEPSGKIAAVAGNQRHIPIVVVERHFLRSHDDEILEFAKQLHRPFEVEYHLSLEDLLLKRYGGDWVKSLIERGGMDEGTPLESAVITRQIRNAQSSVAEKVKDDYRDTETPEEWLRVHLGEISGPRGVKVTR